MKKYYYSLLAILFVAAISISFTTNPGGGDKSEENCTVLLDDIGESYTGECKDGFAHGYGKAEGSKLYEGEFRNGLPHGNGKLVFENGDVYEGEFRKGIRDGKGKIYRSNSGMVIKDGYWQHGGFVGDSKHPYSVRVKRDIDRVQFYQRGTVLNQVHINFSRLGTKNIDIRDLMLNGNNGNASMGPSFYGFQNIEFPFHGVITYKTTNKFNSTLVECRFEFTIYHPGNWEVTLNN